MSTISDSIAKSPSYSNTKQTTVPQPRTDRIQVRLLSELQKTEHLPPADRIRHLACHLKISPEQTADVLRQAGIAVTAEDLQEFYKKRRIIRKQRRIHHQKYLEHKEAEKRIEEIESDENFSFIAGYTSGGMPYGTLWEDTPPAPAPDMFIPSGIGIDNTPEVDLSDDPDAGTHSDT